MKRVWYGELAESPVGTVWAAVSEGGLVAVDFGISGEDFIRRLQRLGFAEAILDPDRTKDALLQISEYLMGSRQAFNLPIDWSGMGDFQKAALQATCAIPYGQMKTYGEIARNLGHPKAARAVGRAEATNPMPLVIPCHRVLGADGALHGYGAGEGLRTKEWLLKLEGYRVGKLIQPRV